MARPTDTSIIKNLLIANGMAQEQWDAIDNHITKTKKIHHSIIFFIIDPFIAVQLIPHSWLALFPDGLISFVVKSTENMEHSRRVALFRASLFFDIGVGISNLIKKDFTIDQLLEFIPACFLDIIIKQTEVLDALISACELYGQSDYIGYTKLQLLK